jgi:hypothetical protein
MAGNEIKGAVSAYRFPSAIDIKKKDLTKKKKDWNHWTVEIFTFLGTFF